MYDFIPYQTIKAYLPDVQKEKVSIKAQEPNQFLDNYRRYGSHLPDEWLTKRHNFIKRTLAAYNKNKTVRRYLSLIVWAYQADLPERY